ncbi:MAG: hypothetical protein RJA42_295 [Bacteroidota bacterium]|jgi:hypothetical protein
MYVSKYTTEDVLKSIEAESAKSIGEIKCALGDLDKAIARIRFILAAIHELKERQKDETQ